MWKCGNIFNFRISQGSVAAYCRWGGNLCDIHKEFFYESFGERILKIGPYWPKLLSNIKNVVIYARDLVNYALRLVKRALDLVIYALDLSKHALDLINCPRSSQLWRRLFAIYVLDQGLYGVRMMYF